MQEIKKILIITIILFSPFLINAQVLSEEILEEEIKSPSSVSITDPGSDYPISVIYSDSKVYVFGTGYASFTGCVLAQGFFYTYCDYSFYGSFTDNFEYAVFDLSDYDASSVYVFVNDTRFFNRQPIDKTYEYNFIYLGVIISLLVIGIILNFFRR